MATEQHRVEIALQWSGGAVVHASLSLTGLLVVRHKAKPPVMSPKTPKTLRLEGKLYERVYKPMGNVLDTYTTHYRIKD